MSKKKVAFICVHNSCRSQIAEALGRHLASDVFQSYSAGTETKPQINQDAVRIMKELYNIDMEAEGQYSKLVSDIPDPDITISMGCNVGCPFIGRPFDDNWGLEDPTGKSDEEFKVVIEQIRHDILGLKRQIESSSRSRITLLLLGINSVLYTEFTATALSNTVSAIRIHRKHIFTRDQICSNKTHLR